MLNSLESWSTIIRNFALLIAAGIALWFAKQRIVVADRQSETAKQGLLNERYQKGAEMLGSEVLPVRLGGIYALSRLAEDDPEKYHIKVMHLFCAFVRAPVGEPVEAALPIKGLTPAAEFNSGQDEADDENGKDRPLRVREDVQEVINLICAKSSERIEIERKAKFKLDLRGAKLRFADLADMILDGALLVKTDLSNAILSGASLLSADVSGAVFENANLSDTRFSGPDAGSPVIGLTQAQLDTAEAEPRNKPPFLNGVVDASGDKLGWHAEQQL